MTQAEAIERVRELSKTQVTVSAELAAKALGTTGQTIREAARQGRKLDVKTIVVSEHRVNVTCASILEAVG